MDYSSLADKEQIERTAKALESRGVSVIVTDSKESVLPLLVNLIPEDATVMTGASLTLKQIGFKELLKSGDHRWHNLKAEIIAEKDPARQSLLRKQATLADYFLGSVHAIAETGEILVASATGSQLAPYAYSSSHVIWLAGAQKIVPSVEAGFGRIREHSLPDEDQRMKKAFGPNANSFIGKILLFERETPVPSSEFDVDPDPGDGGGLRRLARKNNQ